MRIPNPAPALIPWLAIMGAPFAAAPLIAAVHVAGDTPPIAGREAQDSRWSFDLAAALADAQASKRLVLVCFNMDGEQANERALAMYRSADFAAATSDVICVLCSGDAHDDDGATCSRFGFGTCSDHRTSEKKTRRHFYGDLRDNIAPQHILLYPDGLVAWHAVYEVAPSELMKAIEGTHRLKAKPLAERLRSQRAFLEQTGRRAAKDVATAYLQVQARLAQTPVEYFLDALKVLDKDVAERILGDLPGYDREQALPRLRASSKHPNKKLRELAASLASKVETTAPQAAAAAPATPDAKSAPALTSPLKVLGPADSLARVYWAGEEVALDACRDRVTVLWFFLANAADLGAEIAAMNEFAAAHVQQGVHVLGLACTQRPSELVEKLADLGCRFPVGCYQATNGAKLFAVERFPSWVVLDPDTNVVHRSPQDGSAFERTEGRDLAVRMATSPVYSSRLTAVPPSVAKQ